MRVKLTETGEFIQLRNTPELARDLEEWRANDCKHSSTTLRKSSIKGGGIQVKHQCNECGINIGNPQKQKENLDLIPDRDEALNNKYELYRKSQRDDILQKHANLQISKDSEFYKKYKLYLESQEWQKLRELTLKRDGYKCTGCGEGAASEIHHLSYAHVFEEFIFELTSVCKNCHKRLHETPWYALPEAKSSD